MSHPKQMSITFMFILKALIRWCKFFASRMCKIFCVSIDSVSHPSSFMNGYNKTRVNLRAHNRSCECKKSLTHGWWVQNNLHCESSPVARGGEQKNVELAPPACKKLALLWIKAFIQKLSAYLTWCPTKTRTNCPLWISHNRHVLSADPVAM